MDCACCRIHIRSSFLMTSNNTDHWLEPIKRPGIKNLDDWEVIKQDLRQEEINHPETVYQRAFIPGWDD